MNKFFLQLSILCLLSFMFSCNEYKYANTRPFSISDIQETKYLTGEIVDMDEIIMPRFLFLKDNYLFTINYQQEHFVTVFHLPDMKKTGDFISFGNGPNEVLNVSNIQFQDSLVWVLDHSRQQINKYMLNHFFEEKEVVPGEKIKINESFEKILVMKDRLITNSLHHIRSRFSFYDMQGNFIENKGNLPDAGVQMTDLELFEAYFCKMALNPGDESIFVAYINTDLIEIYDSNGSLKTRMHGPDKFYSINKEVSLGNGQQKISSIAGKTRSAYYNPIAFEDEIWTLYDGKYFDRTVENGFLLNRIIVFDWDGNPIRQYITDIGFYALTIDRNNGVFYGITLNPEFAFVKFYF